MVTTKEKPVADTQKIMLKESKHTTTKCHQITKEDSKRESTEQRFCKTVRKQQNGKSLHADNYCKHKWIKLSNQKT